MITICGGCRKKLKIEDALAGQLGRCPACNAVIKIPSVDEAEMRLADEPPPIAEVTTDPFPDSGGVFAPTPGGAPSVPGGIQTDEQGFVLAIPVEDEEPAPAEASGSQDKAGSDTSILGLTLERDKDHEPSPGADKSLPSGEKIITRCSGCGGRLAIEAQFAGKMRTCPGCSTEIRVPLHSDFQPTPPRSGSSGVARTFTGGEVDAESLPEVDFDSYAAGTPVGASGGVAAFWVPIALVVGLVVGFAVGVLTGKYMVTRNQAQPESAPVVQPNETAQS